MPHKHPVDAEATIKRLWEETLQAGDPELTVHRLPAATREDVETLFHTLEQSEAGATSARLRFEASGAPTAVRPAPGANLPSDRTLPLLGATVSRGEPPTAATRIEGAFGPEAALAGGLVVQDYFSLQRELGKGGMGVVFLARQESLDRTVAVKTIRLDRAVATAEIAAFLREALTTASLSHPNIPPVHLFGRERDGRAFMAMKRVEGRPWRELLRPLGPDGRPVRPENHELDLAEHLEIFQKVCDAVAFAHGHGVVHRDLKPENVMIGDYGAVTVMDWGLALNVSGGRDSHAGTEREKASTVAGTPAYMAPEMALGELDRIGPATDIYLLGAILHEILTGRPPHTGSSMLEVLAHAACGRIDPIKHRRGLPREARELEALVRKCLSEDPAQRFASVEELQEEVKAFQAGQGNRGESMELASQARADLDALRREVGGLQVTSPYYPRCAEALAKAHQALALWGHNPRATRVRQEVLEFYADLALRGRDWGLAESLLRDLRLSGSGGGALAQPAEQRLRTQREAWRRREAFFRRAYRFAAVMFFVVLGLSLYLYLGWTRDRGELVVKEDEAARFKRDAETLQDELRRAVLLLKNPRSSRFASTSEEVPLPAPKEVPILLTPPVEGQKTEAPAPVRAFGRRVGPTRRLREGPDGRARGVRGFALGANGDLALWDDEGGAWVWPAASDAPPREPLQAPSPQRRVVHAAWLDEKRLALAEAGGEVRVGDSPQRPWLTPLRLEAPPQHLDGWGDGRRFHLAASLDSKVWEVHDGQGGVEPEDYLVPVRALRVLPGLGLLMVHGRGIYGRFAGSQPVRFDLKRMVALAAVGGERKIALVFEEAPLELLTYRLTPEAKRLDAGVRYAFQGAGLAAVALSGDGRRVLAATARGDLILADADRPQVLTFGRVYESAPRALALAEDGLRGYSAGPDGELDVWDLSEWKP
ncbi:MAG: serine/threonine protein kinase [Planctomycetota bacterium]|nr:serine/threonine protein kinase [Planctomycetota bacterium]